MTIWIDGDSCATKAREAALEIGRNRHIPIKVAADRHLNGVEEREAHLIVVEHGSRQTDTRIVHGGRAGDLVITRDLELAHRLMQKDIRVMNDRGQLWNTMSLQHRREEARIMQAMQKGGMTITRRSDYSSENLAMFIKNLTHFLGSSSHTPKNNRPNLS